MSAIDQLLYFLMTYCFIQAIFGRQIKRLARRCDGMGGVVVSGCTRRAATTGAEVGGEMTEQLEYIFEEAIRNDQRRQLEHQLATTFIAQQREGDPAERTRLWGECLRLVDEIERLNNE